MNTQCTALHSAKKGCMLQVYDIPNIDLDLKVVKTNLPPRTIMRGPGFMDAAMVIEQVLEHVVNYLGTDPESTRRLNFLKAPNEVSKPAVQGELCLATCSSISQHLDTS